MAIRKPKIRRQGRLIQPFLPASQTTIAVLPKGGTAVITTGGKRRFTAGDTLPGATWEK